MSNSISQQSRRSWFARIFFTEAEPLIKLSETQIIDASHKIEMPPEISAYHSNWNESVINWTNGKTLYKSLLVSAKKLMTTVVILQIVATIFNLSTPIFIHNFMTMLQELNTGVRPWTQENIIWISFFAIGLGLCGAGHGCVIQHYFYRALNFYQVSNSIINKKIYGHALKISNKTKQKNQVGEVVNLMSSDAEAIADIAMTSIDLANAAVLLTVCSGMLFYYIGWSALTAIVVMATLIPLTQKLAKTFMHLEEEQLKHRDRRMTIMTQILNAIRVVKYFSWEKSVVAEVHQVRNEEIDSRMKLFKAEILWGLIYVSISTIVLFSALFTHYLRGFEINLALVLTCVAIFSVMEDQFGGLSRFISRFINIFVSGDRITQFLKSESVDVFKDSVEKTQESAVVFDQVNFSYVPEHQVFSNLSFRIAAGESIAVVGGVGSGKTTLLQLILNEMALNQGRITLPTYWKVAYQSQEPFILNASLKENIIFGADHFVESDLQKAIELSALKTDIALFPNGLYTEIGEKGVNLSGGQKQRVCIARCVLARPDLILMDDPLSAVDIHTEASLCENLIFGAWKDKTRIVTTHRISHLKRFDRVLFLSDREKTYKIGTYEELMQTSPEFRNFIEIEARNQESEKTIALSKSEVVAAQITSDNSRITVDEDRVIGTVENSVYKSYIMALGGQGKKARWIVGVIFLSAVIAVLTPLAQKTWITKYSELVDAKTLIYGYGILGLLTMFVYYGNARLWMRRGIRAGRRFHDEALDSILKTEIRFFDSTPVGRILQRFSRDVESVDIHIQWTFEQTVNALLQVTLSFFLIVLTLPITILFLAPILFYYYGLQKAYRRAAREVKRLDSLARSPRYAHFKETLQGLSVIRAFNREVYFNQEFLGKLHHSIQAFYTHLVINRWFSIRLPLVGAFISSVTVLAIVFSSYHQWISAGIAGLITLYAIQFWKYLNWGIRIFSDLESRMTSVERLSFYSELQPEKEFIEKRLPLLPQSGHLSFKNVKLRYADHLPYVLNDVSFEIPSGAKVGIVGRTGSGKSTLFQAVYRFVHYDHGQIFVDGRSIRDYSLSDLRKSLAVIPQDPSLFMGSLKSNLDRYGEKSDDEIYTVLKKVGLYSFVQRLPNKLDYFVTENGSNLSQGQRQLICLARALLMNVKIIFLDEATASVDVETDALVQKVIQESLDGITLVTIAHRLSTLKNYDKIIELDSGRVVT